MPFECEQFADGAPGKVLVRVPTMGEQTLARVQCHAHLEQLCKDSPSAAADQVLKDNLQKVFLIFAAMRDEKEPDELPAFLTPEWLADTCTPQQLSVLMNMYTTVVAKTETLESDFGEERVGALMLLCGEHYDSDVPDRALIRFDREGMLELFVKASVLYGDVARENQILREKIASLETRPAEGAPPGDVQPEPPADGSVPSTE